LNATSQLPVEEDRDAELAADEGCRRERLRDRGPSSLLVEVDDRHHVERAHVRMDPGVGGDVDPRDRRARAAEQRLRHLPLPRRKREHRPVVVGVRVQVEEAGGSERPPDRLERREVTALAHVGHGHQKRRSVHDP
jgi:hypothetical protein